MENGWGEWKAHVLAELRRLSESQEKLSNEFLEFRLDYAAKEGATTGTKKTLATIAGFAGGLLSGTLTRIFFPHQ